MKLKRFPKLLLIPVILVGLGILSVVPSLLSKKSTSTEYKSNVPDTWKTFTSDKYGYSLQYPPGWQVTDNSSETSRQVRVDETNKYAYIKIDAYKDDAMTSKEKVEEGLLRFKDRMDDEPGLTVSKYKSDFDDHVGGYIARGEQTINGQKFIFENRGLLSDNGHILIFHSAYRADKTDQFASITPLIISSFKLE